MLAYKIQNNRTIEYLKDEDRVPSGTYSWHNSDLIYMYISIIFNLTISYVFFFSLLERKY
jgi:ABC-type multidrug transport system permease subunit